MILLVQLIYQIMDAQFLKRPLAVSTAGATPDVSWLESVKRFLYGHPVCVLINRVCFCAYPVINSDDLLRVAHLYIMGNDKCTQQHQGKVTLKESEICAGAEKIGSGPCEVRQKFLKQ